MADDTITVPAAFERPLNALDKHFVAARDLTAAITAINEYQVDLDDDAMAAIEQERDRHRVAATAIAEALHVVCPCGLRRLNDSELYNRVCARCGTKIEVEGEKQ